MKVALVLASNTSYAPHAYHYLKILKEQNIEFDIFIWNKDNIIESDCISFDSSVDSSKSRLSRITGYLNYTKFVVNLLKKNEYQRVIVFTIFLGVLLYPYLKRNFKGSYYFDIRDHSPIISIFPWIAIPLVKNSFATAISSPGFLEWLPKSTKYVLSHNYTFSDHRFDSNFKINVSSRYVILTIGYLRDYETNKRLINAFKYNENFSLKFTGTGVAYQPLLDFTMNNNIKNIVFTGGYDKKDENIYLENATLMNILLDDNLNSSTLMTNRFYLAISNGIPVIVNSNSTQAQYVIKYNLGVIVENKESIEVEVISYLETFNDDTFQKGCKQFLSDIERDQKILEENFNSFILNNHK